MYLQTKQQQTIPVSTFKIDVLYNYVEHTVQILGRIKHCCTILGYYL